MNLVFAKVEISKNNYFNELRKVQIHQILQFWNLNWKFLIQNLKKILIKEISTLKIQNDRYLLNSETFQICKIFTYCSTNQIF